MLDCTTMLSLRSEPCTGANLSNPLVGVLMDYQEDWGDRGTGDEEASLLYIACMLAYLCRMVD